MGTSGISDNMVISMLLWNCLAFASKEKSLAKHPVELKPFGSGKI
jgi:hypothetical protein